MKITKFEDIIAWQKAKLLTSTIYKIFQNCKDYSFKDQIQRASISIMNNIAEGFERKGDKQFKHFLYIAKGSSGEVRSMIYIAHEMKIIEPNTCREIYYLTIEISKLITALIKSIE